MVFTCTVFVSIKTLRQLQIVTDYKSKMFYSFSIKKKHYEYLLETELTFNCSNGICHFLFYSNSVKGFYQKFKPFRLRASVFLINIVRDYSPF